VYSGGTGDPASAPAWRWLVIDGKTQPTNRFPPDQPWIIASKDPAQEQHDNVYVGYQAESMQAAVAVGRLPLDFTIDRSLSAPRSLGAFNPGLRLAANQRTGAIYGLYQQGAEIACPGSALPISYMLNRSMDGGLTWELNGKPDGIAVAQVCIHQNLVTYLFGEPEPGVIAGGVNPLRGGVDAIAVHSRTGDVYVVYGEFDETAGRDRLSIVRAREGGDGRVDICPPHFVSGTQHQSALPAVAVTEDRHGNVGVLYDTADGLDPATLRPYFSIHFALSRDYGRTFEDAVLQKFLFPENAPSGAFGPRPLGDYQQLKSLGNTFYGVFSGDGKPFGRPFHKIDPIFLKTSAP
jgi:hypothetical protein